MKHENYAGMPDIVGKFPFVQMTIVPILNHGSINSFNCSAIYFILFVVEKDRNVNTCFETTNQQRMIYYIGYLLAIPNLKRCVTSTIFTHSGFIPTWLVSVSTKNCSMIQNHQPRLLFMSRHHDYHQIKNAPEPFSILLWKHTRIGWFKSKPYSETY